MQQEACEKYLFLYTVDGNQGDVWAFAQGFYRRFTLVDGGYRFVRAQRYLPFWAAGMCYQFTWVGYEELNQEASRNGFQLNFYTDPLACEQGEILEEHPEWVFGLSKPAGTLWAEDEIERGGGEDSGAR
jgi:hypothetical protein